MQPVIDRFQPIFDENGVELVVPLVNERFEEEELLEVIGDIDGVIAGDDRFTERVLIAAPKLKVLSKWGTGTDSFDHEACKKLGVAIRNTPDAFSQPVADTVLGYMLCFARNLPWMNRAMRDGVWHKIPGRALRECTLGIIGVGNVGKAVASRAVAFGMPVLGNDLVDIPSEFLEETGIRMVSKEEIYAQADFISVNCDLNPTSRHLLSTAQFAQMKPTTVVINTARGPIIDEQAIIKALQTQQIGGAAFDVFENEPLPLDSSLLKMDNVMVAPHNSNSSPEAWERVHMNTINNLFEVLNGAKL